MEPTSKGRGGEGREKEEWRKEGVGMAERRA